jgi:hypothetical protein
MALSKPPESDPTNTLPEHAQTLLTYFRPPLFYQITYPQYPNTPSSSSLQQSAPLQTFRSSIHPQPSNLLFRRRYSAPHSVISTKVVSNLPHDLSNHVATRRPTSKTPYPEIRETPAAEQASRMMPTCTIWTVIELALQARARGVGYIVPVYSEALCNLPSLPRPTGRRMRHSLPAIVRLRSVSAPSPRRDTIPAFVEMGRVSGVSRLIFNNVKRPRPSVDVHCTS